MMNLPGCRAGSASVLLVLDGQAAIGGRQTLCGSIFA